MFLRSPALASGSRLGVMKQGVMLDRSPRPQLHFVFLYKSNIHNGLVKLKEFKMYQF